ncbi:hypothetical protein, partial [Escherichia coli]|uniref:hypothetical protein n=1 Tax=Escherichia coli TaxID=562 RepID=UPI001AA0DD03
GPTLSLESRDAIFVPVNDQKHRFVFIMPLRLVTVVLSSRESNYGNTHVSEKLPKTPLLTTNNHDPFQATRLIEVMTESVQQM